MAELPPKGAQVWFNGLWYKTGLHDRVYYHNGNEWIVSTVRKTTVKAEIIKQNIRSLEEWQNV